MDAPDPLPQLPVAARGGLQYERTALAWERTAIAMIVAGVALARYTTTDSHPLLSVTGVAEILGGGLLLLWATRNSDLLHNPDFPASAVPQVGLTRLIGTTTTLFSACACGCPDAGWLNSDRLILL